MGFTWAQIAELAGDNAIPILKIIWIDLILSGDNAVVIALACRSLPDKQRKWGIILGCAAAILMRIAFAGVITQMLAIPYVKIVAGLLLLWIAIKLLLDDGSEDGPDIKAHDKLWRAVFTVAIADAVMSLDNVIAIAAVAKGSIALIAFGIALSIPLIIFGSTLIMGLIDRFPLFVWFGSGLLGWIAGELFANAPEMVPFFNRIAEIIGFRPDTLHHLIAAVGAILVVLAGLALKKGAERRAARAAAQSQGPAE